MMAFLFCGLITTDHTSAIEETWNPYIDVKLFWRRCLNRMSMGVQNIA